MALEVLDSIFGIVRGRARILRRTPRLGGAVHGQEGSGTGQRRGLAAAGPAAESARSEGPAQRQRLERELKRPPNSAEGGSDDRSRSPPRRADPGGVAARPLSPPARR